MGPHTAAPHSTARCQCTAGLQGLNASAATANRLRRLTQRLRTRAATEGPNDYATASSTSSASSRLGTEQPPAGPAPPAAWSASPSAAGAAPDVASIKMALLQAIAPLNRGALASDADKAAVERLIVALERAPGGSMVQAPLAGSPAPIEGRWQMLYSNTQAFRNSPFFAAFADGLVQDASVAESIFAFTDAIPGADIGAAYQDISLSPGSLVSEVDMTVFPGFKGTVVTSSRLQPLPPDSLALAVESTRVVGSSFSPLLDSVAVPVEQLVEGLRGPGATRVVYRISYLDEALRVTRGPGGQVMLHRRVA